MRAGPWAEFSESDAGWHHVIAVERKGSAAFATRKGEVPSTVVDDLVRGVGDPMRGQTSPVVSITRNSPCIWVWMSHQNGTWIASWSEG